MNLATISLLIFLVFVIILLVTFAWGGLLAAPWIPARKRDVSRILKMASLKPDEVLYDLGSGDGRLIIAATRDFKAKSVGFEVAILPYFLARAKILLLGLRPKIDLKYKNFYGVNLGQADVVTTFLSPWAMRKLKSKFQRELKPGCRVVSYAFSIPGWQPVAVDKPSQNELTVYVYQAPF
jgi:hypothetical protein